MYNITDFNLDDISETLLAPLYWRAMESKRSDSILKDPKAVEFVEQNQGSFERVKNVHLNNLLYVMRIMLTREMDRYALEFLNLNPESVVVHIGCGLDSRFERVDNGKVKWYDLDLPEVISLRRKIFGQETNRYHFIGSSILDKNWIEEIRIHSNKSFLFLAETVFIYFPDDQVKYLLLNLRKEFPKSEVVFDAWKPYEIFLANRLLKSSMFSGLLRWGLWKGKIIEDWAEGIRMIDEWSYFDKPEPRLRSYFWIAPLFRLLKPMSIYHFQLGQ